MLLSSEQSTTQEGCKLGMLCLLALERCILCLAGVGGGGAAALQRRHRGGALHREPIQAQCH